MTTSEYLSRNDLLNVIKMCANALANQTDTATEEEFTIPVSMIDALDVARDVLRRANI